MLELTPFQDRVLRVAAGNRNAMAPVDGIAATFPGWRKRSARGALVALVSRAGYSLAKLGLAHRLPPNQKHDPATIAVSDWGAKWLAERDAE